MRRNDERRRDRDVAGFGRAMRALGRRAAVHPYDAEPTARSDVFVARPVDDLAQPARRPVPVAQEALMYPVDRSELSAARAHMIARRRRSLTILVGGTVLFGFLALIVGGMVDLLFGLFALALAGYCYFLRSQALRDRSRRENRQARAAGRRPREAYDLTDDVERFEDERFEIAPPSTVVRIDDDDFELQSMDTMDLTGLYEAEEPVEAIQRRAS
jgi:hypothetical protein